MSKNIAIIVGSLREGAFSGQIGNYLVANPQHNLSYHIVKIDDLPLYNQDFDGQSIPAYDRYRADIKAADGIVFITPEHNRNVTAAMKNAIDVASRPWGQSVWSGKVAAIISESPGAGGGIFANAALRQSLPLLNVSLLPMEMYFHGIGDAFDDKGNLVNESLKGILDDFQSAYAEFLAKLG